MRERELIRLCAQWSLARAPLSAVQALAGSELNWNLFLDLARAHGLAPAAAACLRQSGAEIPGAVSETLDRLRRENAKRSLIFSAALALVRKQLAQEGVKAAALKGPSLAALCPDPSWRVFGDLDLLVAPGDVDRALESLARIGYRSTEPAAIRRARRRHRAREFELPLEHKSLGVHLDLHWSVLPREFPAQMPVDELLARAEGGALDLADQLIFLAAHGAKHGWSSLDMVIDVCRLRERLPQLDTAFERARRYGAAKMLYYALRVSESLSSFNLLATGPKAENSLRVPLALSGSLRASLVYLAHRIFIPRQADWSSLDDAPAVMHYPWRLMRTGWKALSRGLP